MIIEDIIYIEAQPNKVWDVIKDVEFWPEWSPTVTSVIRLDDGPFKLGSKAKIKQPGQPNSGWTVTEFIPGKRFVWETWRVGLHMRAYHEIETEGKGTTHANRLEATGIIAILLVPIFRSTIRRTLSKENLGLKTKCESENSSMLRQ